MTLSLAENHAFVTGGSSGIGLAIIKALIDQGAEKLYAVGREAETLRALLTDLCPRRCAFEIFQADLSTDTGIEETCRTCDRIEKLDILVHAAGAVLYQPFNQVAPEDFDAQQRLNFKAPFFLTQHLLPALRSSEGQVAFVNSSVTWQTGPSNLATYAAMKAALKVLAETIRTEENKNKVRVFSIYPGQTATPLLRKLCEEQNREYRPECLLQPEDVATAMLQMLTLPRTAEVTDLQIRPFMSTWGV